MQRGNGPRIVLIGGGHTHVEIIRRWPQRPWKSAQLVCVSELPYSTYSGMVPGVLAGQYLPGDERIKTAALCESVGAEFLPDPLCRVDAKRKTVSLASGLELDYDLLSIGIGSTVELPPRTGDRLLPVKPLSDFVERFDAAVARGPERSAGMRILVVGGGAAGFELAVALQRRMQRTSQPCAVTIADAGSRLLAEMNSRTQTLARRHLDRVAIGTVLEARVLRVDDSRVQFQDGRTLDADLIVWAAGAAAPAVLSEIDAEHDDQGFLRVDRTLQVLGTEHVFAVGDTATIAPQPVAKAGVYAVRAAPVLWENLWRELSQEELQPWRPQRNFLRLLNTADGRAILDWKRLAFHHRWVWWLKDRIDRRFVEKYGS